MDKSKVVVFLDPGHCKSTPGKCSPDKSLREYAYVREIITMIEAELNVLGIKHWNTHPEEDFVYKTKGTCKDLDSRDLVLRTTRINNKYNEYKKQGYKCFLISVHVDAAGMGYNWTNATGWSAYTTVGKTNSDTLATCLYEAADELLLPLGKKTRKDMRDGDPDYESNFWVLKKSNCPCVLTENFFQDCKNDVQWLLSETGKNTITDIHVNGILKYITKL